MSDLVILTEKDSARATMAKALGGDAGIVNGHTYQLTNLLGHVLELKNPEEQVSDATEAEEIKTWALENLPWKLSNFKWSMRSTGGRRKKLLDEFKRTVAEEKPDAIVIATDPDPSGEGDPESFKD